MHYFRIMDPLKRKSWKRELVALLLLSFGCLVTGNVLKLFLTVPWGGLQFVIVVFPYHAHLLQDGHPAGFKERTTFSPRLYLKIATVLYFKVNKEWRIFQIAVVTKYILQSFWTRCR